MDYLTSRYRLVVMNDDNFEEQASFKLSRINLYLLISVVLVALNIIIVTLIVVTPLKEYIPGYADVNMRRDITLLKLKVDSMHTELVQKDLFVENIRNIIQGNIDTSRVDTKTETINLEDLDIEEISYEDSMLRAEMESEDNYRLMFSGTATGAKQSIEDYHFFPPIKGFVTSDFNKAKAHYGIDVVAPENESIKATMDGVIIQSSWTLDSGYVIGIQHESNLVSFYKHNSVLLKKVGSFVQAGDVIAIIGSSGELTTGPHLHFELWHNGIPVNPGQYVAFN